MEQENKTAEDILREVGKGVISKSIAVRAMEEYASQQTEQLQKELADLNIQLSNYAYQIDIAKRERDKAEKENADLRQQLAEKEKECKSHFKSWLTSLDRIKELEAGNEELKAFIKDVRSYAGFAFSKDEDRAKQLINSIL